MMDDDACVLISFTFPRFITLKKCIFRPCLDGSQLDRIDLLVWIGLEFELNFILIHFSNAYGLR
jgi:hypothetical protein